MREIEFKAWGVKSKVMVSVAELSWTVGGLRAYGPGCHIEQDEHVQDDNIILLQFTGLRDVSNQKIFDGDIVEDNSGRTFEVFWSPGVEEYQLEAGWSVRTPVFRDGSRECFTMHQWRDNKNLEIRVVGNIYPNPELLK